MKLNCKRKEVFLILLLIAIVSIWSYDRCMYDHPVKSNSQSQVDFGELKTVDDYSE